jgi:N-acetylglucosamine kinase-like BadF-type ATPase
MTYFLGVDVGGTKTAALVANGHGEALGYGIGGPGNYEGVGWNGFKSAVNAAIMQALECLGLTLADISGTGMGIAGYDWPSQKTYHLSALAEIGINQQVEIVNDAVLGILAGAEHGWGVSVVSGTGCNCRGRSRDHKREGRMVGGASIWSGEYAGGFDILTRAMRAVTFEWSARGPKTVLTDFFIQQAGAKDLDDLVEGMYVGRYHPFDRALIMQVFKIAERGDPEALNVLRWAGHELGDMACGVIRQLDLQAETFDIVMIGSIFKGHPLIRETLDATVHQIAPNATLVHLMAPPVVGAVLLGMEKAGVDGYIHREKLIESTRSLIEQVHES